MNDGHRMSQQNGSMPVGHGGLAPLPSVATGSVPFRFLPVLLHGPLAVVSIRLRWLRA